LSKNEPRVLIKLYLKKCALVKNAENFFSVSDDVVELCDDKFYDENLILTINHE